MVQHDPDYSDSKELINPCIEWIWIGSFDFSARHSDYNSVLHSFSILTLSLALLLPVILQYSL